MQQNANVRLHHESRVEDLEKVSAKLLEKTQGKITQIGSLKDMRKQRASDHSVENAKLLALLL